MNTEPGVTPDVIKHRRKNNNIVLQKYERVYRDQDVAEKRRSQKETDGFQKLGKKKKNVREKIRPKRETQERKENIKITSVIKKETEKENRRESDNRRNIVNKTKVKGNTNNSVVNRNSEEVDRKLEIEQAEVAKQKNKPSLSRGRNNMETETNQEEYGRCSQKNKTEKEKTYTSSTL